MQPNVFILTGVIQTGKTTSLMEWCDGKENVQGILTPIVEGKRMFLDIASKEIFAMEAEKDETDVLKVGRFIFSSRAFEKAKGIIANATSNSYLIIDEIGPLELRKEGLHDAVIAALQNQKVQAIILVVREGLVEKVAGFFNINNTNIITKTTLEFL
jgi:nucleoside-triphosphatase